MSVHPHVVCVYIFIAFYLLLKYCIDGTMLIVNYRNMKLILNKGSRVPDSKPYVFTQCTNTTGNIPFNFTLCIQCIEYIDRKRVNKGMMTTHFLNFTCQSVYNLSKVWLHHPPTPSIHHNFSEPPTDSLLQPRNCFIFFHDSTLPQNIVQSPL